MHETDRETSSITAALYLDLMKKCLTRSVFGPPYQIAGAPAGTFRGSIYRIVRSMLPREYEIVRRGTIQAREGGGDWPADAETMIGLRRLDNLEACATDVLRRNVPGDFLEAGVWRGGASIFMRAILRAFEDSVRRVWVADSFRGLPPANASAYPADSSIDWSQFQQLAVDASVVRANFARYGLLDEQVCFLAGWFSETLPTAPVERLALLRLDGDMYESTWDGLRHLHPKVSRGGYVIIDDYHAVEACRRAVDDYRERNGVTDELVRVDESAVFWRRAS